jgi:predicted Zn-dependent protease
MNSSDPRTHYVRAQALIRSGNIEEGQAVLMGYQELAARKAAEEHRTREIASYDNEVRAALERAAFDEAATVLRTAIDEFPDSDTLLLNMGIVLSRLGDHEGAIEALERRLRLGIRHDFASYMALERAAAALGDEDRRLRYRGLYLASLGPALEDTLE